MSNDILEQKIEAIEKELIDSRTSYNGSTYSIAGANIRMNGEIAQKAGNQARALLKRVTNVEADLDYVRNNLDDLINIETVDGLEYKNNTLFLKKGKDLVLPGVQIISGTGGNGSIVPPSSSLDVTIEMLDTSNALNISSAQESVYLNFKFTSLESGNPTGPCTCKILRNGVHKETFGISNGAEVNKDVKDYLMVGENLITVQCSDIYNTIKEINYNINVIKLELTPNLNPYKPILTDSFSFTYQQYGLVDKTIHFFLGSGSSQNHVKVNLSKDADREQLQTLTSPIAHGVHPLEIYIETQIGSDTIYDLYYKCELMFPKAGITTPIIASNIDSTEVMQGEVISIPFVVYDPEKSHCNIILRTSHYIGGELQQKDVPRIVTKEQDIWEVSNLPKGTNTLSIIYEKLGVTYEKKHEVNIIESNISVSPVGGQALEAALLSIGRANTDTDFDIWESNGVTTNFVNFNWGTNGWLNDKADGSGDTCLRLNGDARIEINLTPFYEDFKTNGKTLEFEFAIRDVNNRSAVVIDCLDSKTPTVVQKGKTDDEGKLVAKNLPKGKYILKFSAPETVSVDDRTIESASITDELEQIITDAITNNPVPDLEYEIQTLTGNGVGIQAMADKMFFNSTNQSIQCNYAENQRVRVGFTIQKVSDKRFMCVYLNGVLSGVKRYSSTDAFLQKNPQTIKIGSSECGIDVYAIRSYKLCLDDRQMTNNYISDIPNINDKIATYLDNDVYESLSSNKVLYQKVKQKIPTVTLIGKLPKQKGDKKLNSVRMIFERPGQSAPIIDEILPQIDVQGTSSAGYVRKNWKTKHGKKFSHMAGQLPAKVFCLKVDYAEATGTHNTQNANLIETFYDTPIPPKVVPDNFDLSGRNLSNLDDISKVRTTVAGFPICIFHLDTDDASFIRNVTIADLESGEYNVEFSSKGNFNFDKGAEDVFAFNSNYDVECWEFSKNEDPQSFLVDWDDIPRPLDYWEPRYHKNLDELENYLDAKDYDGADAYARETGMFDRFKKMYEWIRSTARDAATGDALVNDYGDQITYYDHQRSAYTHDTSEYRLAKFRSEFENHFNLEYSLIYYVYTFFALMVDQRAKNMFLTYWRDNAYGPNDETNPGHWYPYFYDNDTCYGISNKGHLDFDYYHQDHDSLVGSNVFNGANSILWCNFRDAFQPEIEATYKKLRSDEKLSYSAIINQFITEGSDKWSAAIYNQDADYKYISVEEDVVDGIPTPYPYLFQIRGDGARHLEYFVKNRIKFCDSKWKCGEFLDNLATVNIYDPGSAAETVLGDSIKVRPPKKEIEITPFSRMYYGVLFGSNTGDDLTKGMIHELALDTTTPIKFTNQSINQNASDFETYIYNASEISSLGDLSYLYPKQVIVSKCIKLTDLIIGCRELGYCNPNLTVVTTGSNTLLRKIDVSNCSNLTGDLDLGGCTNIEEIYAGGTQITGLILPTGGYINTVVLPETFSSLVLKGQQYLTNSGLQLADPTKLVQLNIDNCPKLDILQLLESCKIGDDYSVQFARLTNIDLGEVSYEYLMDKLGSIGAIDADGTTHRPEEQCIYIQGRCRIPELSGEQLADIKAKFPDLVVYYDRLELQVVFKSEDGTETLYTQEKLVCEFGNSSEGVKIKDPVTSGSIEEIPTKSSTQQYHFTFGGWSRVPDGEPDTTALLGITSNITLYVAFNKSVRSYTVTFHVANTSLEVQTDYGHTAVYPEDPRDKLSSIVSNPYIYEHVGWEPSCENIVEDTHCYAQFVINEASDDIGNYALIEFDYDLDTIDKTITLNRCIANENIGRIKETYLIATDYTGSALGTDYTVTALGTSTTRLDSGKEVEIGCFDESDEALTSGIIIDTGVKVEKVVHRVEYVVLPDSLEVIGVNAFNCCSNLVAINIPESVSSIDPTAFDRCLKLESITAADDNKNFYSKNNCLINRKNEELVIGPAKKCDIPEGVTSLGAHSFWGRKYLNSITFPSTLIQIGRGALADCENLFNIDLPEGITTLGPMSLFNTGIKQLILPKSIVKIGMLALGSCKKLKHIYFNCNATHLQIKDRIFDGILAEGATIHVPWSEGQGNVASWGATGAIMDYNWSGEIYDV